VDTVIAIPNDRLLELVHRHERFEAFRVADDILRQAVKGIAALLRRPD